MKTCEEVTYDRLKTLIVGNKLPQGEFLSQRKLAKSVGATLVTLRSSLRLLENDGLLENVPKWGVRIPVESEESIQERYYVRELLEVGAVDKMLDMNIPNSQNILMEKAEVCDEVKLTGPESFKDFAHKHTDLHLTITRLSGNKLLYRELNRLNFRSMMLSNSKYGWEMQGENLIAAHHQDFVRAIFAPNRQKALQAVRAHIRRGCTMELGTLRKLNQIKEEASVL
jgi:DNA-binding GntR family transcriptional regulator